MEKTEVLKYIEETNAAADRGDFEEALRISGEGLAMADKAWTECVNSGGDGADLFWDCCYLAETHGAILANSRMSEEAFSLAAMMLCQIVERDIDIAGHEDNVLMFIKILSHAATDYGSLLEDEPAVSEQSKNHMIVIVVEACSMLYAHYQKWVGLLDPTLAEMLYHQLKGFLDEGMILYPEIKTPEVTVHPDNLVEVLGDIIGRARAIGLFNVD